MELAECSDNVVCDVSADTDSSLVSIISLQLPYYYYSTLGSSNIDWWW